MNNFTERINKIFDNFGRYGKAGKSPFKTLWDVIENNHKVELEMIADVENSKKLHTKGNWDPEDPNVEFALKGYTLLTGSYDDIEEMYSYQSEVITKYIFNKIKNRVKSKGSTQYIGQFTFDFVVNNKAYKGIGWYGVSDGGWFYLKWDDMLKLKSEFKKVKLP